MIKTISLLTRKQDLSHEEFVHHWVEVHAPLAHGVPGLRRYIQSHIIGERTRPDIPTPDIEIDGIAELWFDAGLRSECAAKTNTLVLQSWPICSHCTKSHRVLNVGKR